MSIFQLPTLTDHSHNQECTVGRRMIYVCAVEKGDVVQQYLYWWVKAMSMAVGIH